MTPLSHFFHLPSCISYRRSIVGTLVLLLSLFTTSCQEAEEWDDTPQGNLDALWQTIDQRYCFLSQKEAEIGLDWTRVHATYSKRLKPDMTRMQLFEVLSAMLCELRDGHVNLYTSLDMARNWSWKEDYPENFRQDIQDAYLGKGGDYHIASGLKYRILDDNVAYVVVSSFSSGIGDGNLSDMLSFLRTTNGMILDVRNNGGGSLETARTLARRFTNETRLVGYMSHKTGTGHNDFSTPMPEYIEPSPYMRWQKPVVLLTNRSCFSATNTFVRDMRNFPLVTTMGDKTGGGGGMPYVSQLPCGWTIRFSAVASFDHQMSHIEGGIEPDVTCSLDSTDAARGVDTLIEEARRMINKMQ